MWQFLNRVKTKNIIAVDIGTASVSVVCAREGVTEHEVISIIREPFYLLDTTEFSGAARRVERALEGALKKAHDALPYASEIRIGLSDPFFEERREEMTAPRKNPNAHITQEELRAFVGTLTARVPASSGHANIKETIDFFAVNGYSVDNPIGYRGSTITLRVFLLATSALLKERVVEFCTRFWRSAHIVWFSDGELLVKSARDLPTLFYPAALLDIGGEVTSIWWMPDQKTFERKNSVFVGLRTLERRIATLLSVDNSHAEALVRNYGAGTLDKNPYVKMLPVINSTLNDWWQGVSNSLGIIQKPFSGSAIIVGGQGRDVPAFMHFLEDHRSAFSHSERPVVIVPLVTNEHLIPPTSLSRGGDIVLTALLRYAHAT